jgi:hypothetical protein
MDEVDARRAVTLLRDTVRLLEAGKPIPVDFLKKEVAELEAKLPPPAKTSNPPPERYF